MLVTSKQARSMASTAPRASSTRGRPKEQRPRARRPATGRNRAKARKERVERMGSDTKQTQYLGKIDTVIANREFVFDVISSQLFSTTTLDINPGLSSVFPWASLQAAGWEKYRIEELIAEYIPRVSAFADNGKSGIVALQFEFDPSDTPPATKTEMLASRPNVNDLPCKSLQLAISAHEMNKTTSDSRYVRSGRVPPDSDIKWYDVGKLNIATEGQATNGAIIGEIHLSYRIRFEVPQLTPTGLPDPRNLYFAYSALDNAGAQSVEGYTSDPLEWNGHEINTLGMQLIPNGAFARANFFPGVAGNYAVDLDVNVFIPNGDDYEIGDFIQSCYIIPNKNGADSTPLPGDHWEAGELTQSGGGPLGAVSAQYAMPIQHHLHQKFLFQLEDEADNFGFKVFASSVRPSDPGSPPNLQITGSIFITPV